MCNDGARVLQAQHFSGKQPPPPPIYNAENPHPFSYPPVDRPHPFTYAPVDRTPSEDVEEPAPKASRRRRANSSATVAATTPQTIIVTKEEADKAAALSKSRENMKSLIRLNIEKRRAASGGLATVTTLTISEPDSVEVIVAAPAPTGHVASETKHIYNDYVSHEATKNENTYPNATFNTRVEQIPRSPRRQVQTVKQRKEAERARREEKLASKANRRISSDEQIMTNMLRAQYLKFDVELAKDDMLRAQVKSEGEPEEKEVGSLRESMLCAQTDNYVMEQNKLNLRQKRVVAKRRSAERMRAQIIARETAEEEGVREQAKPVEEEFNAPVEPIMPPPTPERSSESIVALPDYDLVQDAEHNPSLANSFIMSPSSIDSDCELDLSPPSTPSPPTTPTLSPAPTPITTTIASKQRIQEVNEYLASCEAVAMVVEAQHNDYIMSLRGYKGPRSSIPQWKTALQDALTLSNGNDIQKNPATDEYWKRTPIKVEPKVVDCDSLMKIMVFDENTNTTRVRCTLRLALLILLLVI